MVRPSTSRANASSGATHLEAAAESVSSGRKWLDARMADRMASGRTLPGTISLSSRQTLNPRLLKRRSIRLANDLSFEE